MAHRTMRAVATLVTLVVGVLALALVPSQATASSLPACVHEDGSGGPTPCYWDGEVRGNGEGHSVVIHEVDGPSTVVKVDPDYPVEPEPQPEPQPEPEPRTYYAERDGGPTVTVEAGDTLSSIAAEHGTTWPALAELNGIDDPDLIYAGEVLLVG